MKKESTKKQFLTEALKLFAEFGYDSVSISQIAERVGCSAPALYKHYSGKHALFDEIIEKADAYCIATASVAEIDELNILQATMLAMKRAVEGLGIKPDMALIDGNRMPELDCPADNVIKGDAKSASISAASVLAKVARDRYMRGIAEKYPQYCFEQHKGYGTKLHCDMLKQYGASDVHRKTFLKKILGESDEHR